MRVTHNRFIYIRDAINVVVNQFKAEACDVHTGTWQGKDISKRPEAAMKELLNVTLAFDVGDRNIETLGLATGANMPWAENHFQERVCGEPINPGVEWKNWPYAHRAAESLDESGRFNHNYMQRYWPKFAGSTQPSEYPEDYLPTREEPHRGISHDFGDLNDVVNLLARDPLTRQAFLPVFFPEDTGAVHGDRVPCTLGYHLIMRDDELHMVYYLRSCDLVRHFRDDIYLSVRLQMWVLKQLQERFGERWLTVKPGSFTMHVTSLHCFVNDFRSL